MRGNIKIKPIFRGGFRERCITNDSGASKTVIFSVSLCIWNFLLLVIRHRIIYVVPHWLLVSPEMILNGHLGRFTLNSVFAPLSYCASSTRKLGFRRQLVKTTVDEKSNQSELVPTCILATCIARCSCDSWSSLFKLTSLLQWGELCVL